MRILGISCHYHDAAACLVEDGEIVAAAEEERFSRIKHDAAFPVGAIRYCLERAGISARDLDHVAFYEKPLLKLERIIASSAETFPRSRAVFTRGMRRWLTEKLWVKDRIRRELGFRGSILFGEHHVSHAASAFFPSPFDDAAVVTADGVGEWATATISRGSGTDLAMLQEIAFPHSLGLLYSAFTAYLGFEVNEGEYKVMGMAAYGRPRHVDKVRRVVSLAADASFRLDLRYFGFHHSLRTISDAFVELFGPPRSDGSPLEAYADIAASIQAVVEEAMLALAVRARELTGSRNLCMAGGVALNVLANARILREAGYDDVWIQPAAGDSGGSIGAALYLYHTVLGNPRAEPMRTAALGPSFRDDEIRTVLARHGIPFQVLSDEDLPDHAARSLAAGNVVGWFQGRMEMGPRALGSRSILADPTLAAMKDRVNEKIKHREPFRPFAPAVTLEAVDRFFELDPARAGRESPYMLFVARALPAAVERVPAVVHVDGTARVQTVRREDDPLFHRLLCRFEELRGVPVLLNTSFNVRGEPIVCTPEHALNSYAYTDMDGLYLGRTFVTADAKRPLRPYPGRTAVGAGAEVQL